MTSLSIKKTLKLFTLIASLEYKPLSEDDHKIYLYRSQDCKIGKTEYNDRFIEVVIDIDGSCEVYEYEYPENRETNYIIRQLKFEDES